MASLIDRLRRAQPQGQRPAKPPAESCLIRTQQYDADAYPPLTLTPQALHLLTGLHTAGTITPQELLFLDTETTGLQGGAGTVAFLVGLGRFTARGFEVTQYLMRDYDEEPFVLGPVREAMEQASALVTFNGASFDLPLLDSRFVMNRMPPPRGERPHLDLLHIARRVHKMRLPRCSLAQLEEQIFCTPREDDLPGREVPERFFRYLQTREEALLEDVLRHNAQDIASLARLLGHLSALHLAPQAASDQRDLYSLGRVMEKRGQQEQAMACFRAVDERGIRDLARWRMYDLMRRAGDHSGAAQELEGLRAAGRGDPKVFIALAKLYEHRFRDPFRALEITRQGMLYCLERLSGYDENSPEYLDLAHRARRLMAKGGA